MNKTIHMCLDIRGALNWPKRMFNGMAKSATDENGRPLTPDQFRDELYDELAKGHRVIPLTPQCEGFDYQTGCPGHPTPAPTNEAA